VQYVNNLLEQDDRAIKRRVRASQGFRSFWGAYRTIQGYEPCMRFGSGKPGGWASVRLSANSIIAGLSQIAIWRADAIVPLMRCRLEVATLYYRGVREQHER
jgi:hypothetical protein